MEPLKVINKRLDDYFGHDLEGNPYYRLVWSTSQLEIRKGYFRANDNLPYLLPYEQTREVPKYPFDRDRYVLEKKVYAPPTNELPIATLRGYSYEPIFIFKDKFGKYLEPIWRVIEIYVTGAIKGPESVFTSRTEEQEREKLEAEDIKYFEESLEDNQPYLPTMLHNKEAVINQVEKGSIYGGR
jgi:hypothetical protein